MIALENNLLRVEMYPEHGFVIGAIVDRGSGVNILWNPPQASFKQLSTHLGAAGEASIDRFDGDVLAGGWFTMIPNAGLPGQREDLWMHGEAARLPWDLVEKTSDFCRCQVLLRESKLKVERIVHLDGATVRSQTFVRNQADQTATLTPGEHPCFSRAVFAGGQVMGLDGAQATVPSLAQPNAARFAAGTQFVWPHAPRSNPIEHIPLQATAVHDHLIVANMTGSLDITVPSINRVLRLACDCQMFSHLLFWSHYMPPNSPWPGDVFAWEPIAAPARSYDEVQAELLVHLAPDEEISWWMSLSLLVST